MYAFQTDVWRLLKCNISKGQLIGYMAANVVGLAVVLIGILFFSDSRADGAGKDAYFSEDYIVISKKVSGIGFSPANFDDEDIRLIEKQPWAKRVGKFTSSRFAVNGAVNLGGRGFSSYMFFESVPDEFFDIKPRDWAFDPEEKFVPIILNKDYLSLYNYGFAVPQHLPQVSEEVIGAVPITLRLTGDGMMPEYFDAAVVGFSSRLNTIAVPQSFMDWANSRYASSEALPSSRLIVQIDRLQSDALDDFLSRQGWEASGNEDGISAISSFLAVVSSVVTANGLIISILAIFILILSIFLMLQKSRVALRYLMLLGYSPAEIARYYNVIIVAANVLVATVALVVTLIARHTWTARLHDLDMGDGSVAPMLITLFVYLVVVTTIDLNVVRTHLRRIWNN